MLILSVAFRETNRYAPIWGEIEPLGPNRSDLQLVGFLLVSRQTSIERDAFLAGWGCSAELGAEAGGRFSMPGLCYSWL